jgi:hypothetical protein
MRETQVYGLAPLHKSNSVVYTLSGEPSFGFYIILAMMIVGFAILVISIINYVNLSVATSLKRAKEIGVKKIHGAGRPELVKQFLAETIIVVTLAGIMASLPACPYFEYVYCPNSNLLPFSLSPYLLMVLGSTASIYNNNHNLVSGCIHVAVLTTYDFQQYLWRFFPAFAFAEESCGDAIFCCNCAYHYFNSPFPAGQFYA